MRTSISHRARRARSTVLALAVAAGLAGSLAACSDDSSDSDSSSAAQSGTLTVTHTMGSTEVPRNPGKILSFSPAFTDAFSALGRPVDTEFRSEFITGTFPWAGEDSGEIVSYTGTSIPDVEKIADADPDVIFAGWIPDQESYDKLNAIAPTVGTVGGSPMTDDWRTATALAGEVTGRTDEATSLVEAVDRKFADTKKKYPALDGATAVFGQAGPQGVGVVTGTDDPANVFLSDLGLVIPDGVKAASSDGSRAYISEENSDLLNTDLLVMWAFGISEADISTTIRGWNDLTPVKNGSALLVDNTSVMSLSTPSVLSVPWALEKLDSTFAAVQAAK